MVLFLLLNVAGKLINIAFQLLEDHFAPLILKRILIVTQHTIFRQLNSAEFGNWCSFNDSCNLEPKTIQE